MEKNIKILSKLFEQVALGRDEGFQRIAVPEFLARTLIGHFGIKSDLQLIKRAFIDYSNPKKEIDRPLYFYAIISLYGKCFTNASKSKMPNLGNSDFDDRPDLLEIHEEVMQIRHNFVAHRGMSNNDASIPYISINKENTNDIRFHVRRGKVEHFPGKHPSIYVDLIDYLIEKVDLKIKKNAKKTYIHLMEELSPEELALLKLP